MSKQKTNQNRLFRRKNNKNSAFLGVIKNKTF